MLYTWVSSDLYIRLGRLIPPSQPSRPSSNTNEAKMIHKLWVVKKNKPNAEERNVLAFSKLKKSIDAICRNLYFCVWSIEIPWKLTRLSSRRCRKYCYILWIQLRGSWGKGHSEIVSEQALRLSVDPEKFGVHDGSYPPLPEGCANIFDQLRLHRQDLSAASCNMFPHEGHHKLLQASWAFRTLENPS